MKGLLCTLSFLLLATSVFCGPEGKKVFEECKKELGLPEGPPSGPPDFEKNPEFRCMPACVCKKMGRIVDGKIVLEKYLEFAGKMFSNPDPAKITGCVEKGNAEKDECDVPLVAMKCMKEQFGDPKFKPTPPAAA